MFKSRKDKLNKELMKQGKNEIEKSFSGEKNLDMEREHKAEEGKEQNNKQTEDMQKQLSNLKDQLLRKAADFENYKKRMDNELSSFLKYANENLIIDLLPVLDDFERLNASWDEKHDAESYKQGIDLIYEKFKKVLQKYGVKEIGSAGKPFDVNLHDAVLQIPKNDVKSDTVVDEVEKGYYLKDKVIRHAKVIVSKEEEVQNPDQSLKSGGKGQSDK